MKDFPSNKNKFIKLLNFFEEIVRICKGIRIEPIIYGSLAVFIYTKNNDIKVNDIDALVQEKDFGKIIKTLKERKIKFKYDKKWHTMHIFKDKHKIELDSIEYWLKDLPHNFKKLNFNGISIKILNINTLRKVYEKASEVSQDYSEEYKKKFKDLANNSK